MHVHALVLDGVFTKDGSGVVGFHPGPRLTALDVAEVLATVEPRIKRMLDRRGLYALRPPVAGDRVRVTEDGQVVLQLRHQWLDGTTRVARCGPAEARERAKERARASGVEGHGLARRLRSSQPGAAPTPL